MKYLDKGDNFSLSTAAGSKHLEIVLVLTVA